MDANQISNMAIKQINKSIQLLDDEVIKITKNFAEKNLSKTCLKYAEDKTPTHYFWTLEEYGYAVLFELPAVFKINTDKAIHDLAYRLDLFSKAYVLEVGINSDNYIEKLEKNRKKEIVY